jgi:hypothetical protein
VGREREQVQASCDPSYRKPRVSPAPKVRAAPKTGALRHPGAQIFWQIFSKSLKEVTRIVRWLKGLG